MDDYQHLLHPRTSVIVQDAGLWRRASAFIIDILIIDIFVTAPMTPVFEPMLQRMQENTVTTMTYTNMELAAVLLIFTIAWIYFSLFEYLLGQTPGMMLMRLRTQGPRGITHMLMRNSFLLPFFPFIILWAVEPFAIGFWRRSVLEHITGTRTVHEQRIIA